jgi:hypothetical protein
VTVRVSIPLVGGDSRNGVNSRVVPAAPQSLP